MVTAYGAAMSLLVAGTFGTPGYALWGVCWAVAVFRHTSKPRNSGADLTEGQEPCAE